MSDERGRALNESPIPSNRIGSQLGLLLNDYQNLVVGWWGIDEPYSIDNFYPIGIVAQTLRDYQPKPQQLYIPFMGAWDGVYHDYNKSIWYK